MDGLDYLGNLVVIRNIDGTIATAGRCITYCDDPVVVVQLSDGSIYHSRAKMCEVIPVDKVILDHIFPKI